MKYTILVWALQLVVILVVKFSNETLAVLFYLSKNESNTFYIDFVSVRRTDDEGDETAGCTRGV